MTGAGGYLRRVLEAWLHPQRVEQALESLVAIALVLIVARLALAASVAVMRRWMRPDDPSRPPDRQAQVRTIVPLAESVLRYALYFTALVLILDRLGFRVGTLVASAGLVGLALGFAAQPLIRDFLSGFLLLFEGLMQVGDIVRIGDAVGQVESIGLRTTQVRRFSGELVTIPNGQILQFGNQSRGFMRAIVQVGIAYEADLQRALAVMEAVGRAWAAEHADVVLAPPQVQGILEFGADSVQVRLVVMVTPSAVGDAEPDLRLRLKAAFDDAGIGLASVRRVAYLRPPAPAHGPDALTSPAPEAAPHP